MRRWPEITETTQLPLHPLLVSPEPFRHSLQLFSLSMRCFTRASEKLDTCNVLLMCTHLWSIEQVHTVCVSDWNCPTFTLRATLLWHEVGTEIIKVSWFPNYHVLRNKALSSSAIIYVQLSNNNPSTGNSYTKCLYDCTSMQLHDQKHRGNNKCLKTKW